MEQNTVMEVVKLLFKTVQSLYIDRIRPQSPDIERRLHEYSAPDWMMTNYLRLYTMQPNLYSVDDNCIYLCQNPVNFVGWVDPKAPNNPFSEDRWRSFVSYILEIQKNDSEMISMKWQFKGGRYGMAMALVESGNECVKGLALGEVCHFMQLAITAGILAYENNVLQPVAACYGIASAFLETSATFKSSASKESIDSITSSINNQFTKSRRLSTDSIITNDSHENISVDINEFKSLVKSLLDSNPNGILLSQFKKLFLNEFGMTITPSIFGYTKLSSLLCCPELQDCCVVFTQPKTNRVAIYPVNQKTYSSNRTISSGMPNSPAAAKAAGLQLMQPLDRKMSFEQVGVSRNVLSAPTTHNSITFAFWSSLSEGGCKQPLEIPQDLPRRRSVMLQKMVEANYDMSAASTRVSSISSSRRSSLLHQISAHWVEKIQEKPITACDNLINASGEFFHDTFASLVKRTSRSFNDCTYDPHFSLPSTPA
eukprot:GHVL01021288.1.p1 GENE.GHVL01021288.1~~GHVL01021288.1.p1  ORF type:complete len:483 (+),score=66.71 GHVL01021288.1:59-1507(+)